MTVVSKELYLPVGKQILFRMTSNDVIHSFWVPEFRLKQDVVPGRITELRITPTVEGDYKVRCAELCGTSHYSMENPVLVVSQEEYDAWFEVAYDAAIKASQTPEGRGQTLVVANGCAACHSITDTPGIGPTWFNLIGRTEELTDGSTVVVDEAYVHESIRTPQEKIVAGFENQLMPTYSFTDEEIADIIAYIKTLR